MNAAKDNMPLAASEPQTDTDNAAPLTAHAVRVLVEELLSQHHAAPARELISFNTLVTRTPLSARTLRAAIKSGKLPYIRLPGARRLLFDWETVHSTLLRHQRGGSYQQ